MGFKFSLQVSRDAKDMISIFFNPGNFKTFKVKVEVCLRFGCKEHYKSCLANCQVVEFVEKIILEKTHPSCDLYLFIGEAILRKTEKYISEIYNSVLLSESY